jgi:hypothetical protein
VYNNGYRLESLQVQGVLVEDYLVNGKCSVVIIIGPELLRREIDMLCSGFRKLADRTRGPRQWDGVAEVVSALSTPVIARVEYSVFQCIKDATGKLLL